MQHGIETLSRRVRTMLEEQAAPGYFEAHFSGSRDLYNPTRNPDGYIGLCIAENKLVADLVANRLDAVGAAPPEVLGYDAMTGSMRFRRQLGRFMNRAVLGREFPPEQISVLAGAGSVLEILFHALGDPGDGVLVPTPSYAGFWLDLERRNQLAIVPVHTQADDGFRLTEELLDRAIDEAARPVKALLFTNPDNPLGRVAPPDDIEAILAWAEARGLHVVFDEIYALSVFGEQSFVSCAERRPVLGDRVHIVWAFSKDFGASGLRCGVLVSENEAVNAAVDALAYWACCSGHTQHLLGELISDDPWVDGYVASMRALLGGAYRRVTAALDVGEIRFMPAEAGFFVLVDLRRFLSSPTWEAEDQLWRRILNETRVNLTPGSACHVGEPGFFRLCYAGLPTETVEVGVQRIAQLLG